MPEVLCTLPLPDPFTEMVSGAAQLTVAGRIHSEDELCALLAEHPCDVLCPQLREPVSARVLDAAGERLRCVSLFSVGHNNCDVAAATARGVTIGNTPGVLTDATADMAMGLILATMRRICEGDAAVRGGDFAGWEPGYMLGRDLRGALLGVIGFGRIGQATARRALACGMRVVHAARESSATSVDADLVDVPPMPLEELLRSADVVSLHVPLTDATHHLIDEIALRAMKPTAVLINTARGPVIDEAALVRALREGWIWGAGLDVYEEEPRLAAGLADCRNAVLAPHLGSATVQTRAEMARLCALNALDALDGRLPRHCVNPQAWQGRSLA